METFGQCIIAKRMEHGIQQLSTVYLIYFLISCVSPDFDKCTTSLKGVSDCFVAEQLTIQLVTEAIWPTHRPIRPGPSSPKPIKFHGW